MAGLSDLHREAAAKASLNRAYSALVEGSHGLDPKPGELPMARVKL